MSLAVSSLCRFCCEANDSGVPLFEDDLAPLASRYLPLKIEDDGKLPRTICPGCHIQLQATISFFNLIIDGQKKLRQLRQAEIVEEQKFEFLQKNLGLVDASKGGIDEAPSICGEQAVSLEDLSEVMQLSHSLFSPDDLISLRMEGIDKPKRKRGRPRKDTRVELASRGSQESTQSAAEPPPTPLHPFDSQAIQEFDSCDGKARRKRKLPSRYREAVQGKELERILREEGVFDDVDYKGNEMLDAIKDPEVIGHMESKEGLELGEVILNKVPSSSHRRKSHFQCEVCSATFTQQMRFLDHKMSHELTPTTVEVPTKTEVTVAWYKCEGEACGEKFVLEEEAETHREVTGHPAAVLVECKDVVGCEEGVVGTHEDVEEVNEEQKEVEKKYSCPVCGKQFRLNGSLKGHMLSSHRGFRGGHSNGYPCDICGQRLRHPSSIIYHKETCHGDGRRFVCHKCSKSFKHRQLLKRHQLVHSEKRPHYCKQCGASFKTKANLMNHQATHSDIKKFFCEICGHQFSHKTSLTLHYRWHSGDKPYQCDVCKKRFTQKGNLQEHVRIHTGEKPFACQVCSRRFTTSSQHKLHLKRHTGERPFKCPHCDKCFLHRDTWKCHVRRHTGDRPFRCEHCERRFTDMWALRKHLRLHTGEKPFTCPICYKAFADCSNLKKHKKVHIKEVKQKKDDTTPPLGVAGLVEASVVNAISASSGADGGLHFFDMIATHDGGEGEQGVSSGQEVAVEAPPDETDTSAQDIQQLIYVTYQDQSDPTSKISEKYFMVPGCAIDRELECKVEDDVSQSMMHVMDTQGNPIRLTLQDGTQLQVSTTDGNNLQVTTNHGQVIPVQLSTTEGESLSMSLAPVQAHLPSAVTELVMDKEALAQISIPENIEFITDDNQEVRMLTTINPSSIQIPSSYLTIG